MDPQSPKVFVIGMQKTGTTSMGEALARLGYRNGGGFRINHPRGVQIDEPITREKVWEIARQRAALADAFEDNPWPMFYREVDAAFPGSKFILTERASAEWLKSVVRHFADNPGPYANLIYGVDQPRGNETRYLEVYQKHNADVRAYFAKRPRDLLVLDLEGGHGWPELCGFLGRSIPSTPFPHMNRASSREAKQRSTFRQLRKKISDFFVRPRRP